MSDNLKFTLNIENNSEKIGEKFTNSIQRVLYYAGINGIEKIVKTSMPVDTGRLRASINFLTPTESGKNPMPQVTESESGDKPEGKSGIANTVIFATNVEYASFVEFGTNKQSGKHFMANGIQEALPKIQEGAEKILKGEL